LVFSSHVDRFAWFDARIDSVGILFAGRDKAAVEPR
jgi:hypothetical protein